MGSSPSSGPRSGPGFDKLVLKTLLGEKADGCLAGGEEGVRRGVNEDVTEEEAVDHRDNYGCNSH